MAYIIRNRWPYTLSSRQHRSEVIKNLTRTEFQFNANLSASTVVYRISSYNLLSLPRPRPRPFPRPRPLPPRLLTVLFANLVSSSASTSSSQDIHPSTEGLFVFSLNSILSIADPQSHTSSDSVTSSCFMKYQNDEPPYCVR